MGIIGLGDIGLCVAERAKAFGIKVIGQRKSGRTPQVEQKIRQTGIKLVDTKEELVSQSNIISVHVPYNSETHGLINRDLLRYFMDDAILINTSRGEIVDEEALLEAISKRALKLALTSSEMNQQRER